MTTSLDYAPTIKLSANTLDNYAAAAGRKYMNISSRIKQKIKSVPVLDKIVKNVKTWDQKMTQKHGAAYKFAKGAVLGATIGVGLAVAGAEVATAYAAVNAVRAAGSLLAQAENARREGKAAGFSDFAAKNKMAVGLAAVSIGMSAAGVTAGVIENQVAASVISSARQAAVGGIMATSTAAKIHKINSEKKDGKITAEQAKQAKKEHMAGFVGNIVGLMALASASTQTEAFSDSPSLHQQAADHVYDGGALPEATVTADAPTPSLEPAQTTPAPDFIKSPEPFTAPVNPETPLLTPDSRPIAPDVAPQLDTGIDPSFYPLPDQQPPSVSETPELAPVAQPSPVERDTYVSFSNTMSPTTHTVDLDIADTIRSADGENHQESSLFASVHDVKGSNAKLMSFNLVNDGETHHIPEMHIAADGRVTPLPDWESVPDANGDGHLSDREISEWSAKRQASLQSVLSEQEAKNVAATEIDQERKIYNGADTQSVHVERAAGQSSGPNDNSAAQARETGTRLADKIASAARDMMTKRVDANGNTIHVTATERQIDVADILLRSAAAKSK